MNSLSESDLLAKTGEIPGTRIITIENKDVVEKIRELGAKIGENITISIKPRKKEKEFSPEFSERLAGKFGLDFELYKNAFLEGYDDFKPIQGLMDKGLGEFEETGNFDFLITELLNFKNSNGTEGFSLFESAILYCYKNSPAKNTFKKLKKHFLNFSLAVSELVISDDEEKNLSVEYASKNPLSTFYHLFFIGRKKGVTLPESSMQDENYCRGIMNHDSGNLFHALFFFPALYPQIKCHKDMKNSFLNELSYLLFREINTEFSFREILTNPVFFPIWEDWCQKFQSELGNPNSEVREAFLFLFKKNKDEFKNFKKYLKIVEKRKEASSKKRPQTNGSSPSKFAEKLNSYVVKNGIEKKETFQIPEISHNFDKGNSDFTVPNFQTALEQNPEIKLWVKVGRNGWKELDISSCESSLKELNLKPGDHNFVFRFAPEANSPKDEFAETKTLEINIPKPVRKEPALPSKNNTFTAILKPKIPTPDTTQAETTSAVEKCLSPITLADSIETTLCDLYCDFDGNIDLLLKKITYEIKNNLVFITLPKEYSPLKTLTIDPALDCKLISPQMKDLDPDVLEFLYDLASKVWHKNNDEALASLEKKKKESVANQAQKLEEKIKTNVEKWCEETNERRKLIKNLGTLPRRLSNALKKNGFEKSLKEVWDHACKEENREQTRKIFRKLKDKLKKNDIECVLFLENNTHYGIEFTIQYGNEKFCGKIGISSLNGEIRNMEFDEEIPLPWQEKLEIIGKGFFAAMISCLPQVKEWKKQTPYERLINRVQKLTKGGLVLRENVWKDIVAGEPIEIAIYDKNGNLTGTKERVISAEDLINENFVDDLLVRNPNLNFFGNSKEENGNDNFDLREGLQMILENKENTSKLSSEIAELAENHREKIRNAVETTPQVLEFLEIPRNQKYFAKRIQATAQLICNGRVDSYGKEPLRNKKIQEILWKFLSSECGFKSWEEVIDYFNSHENAPTKFIAEKLHSFQNKFFRELANNGFSVSVQSEATASLSELKLLAKNDFRI